MGASAWARDDWTSQLDPAVVEQARKEGAVTYYSAMNQTLTEEIARAFAEAFPGVEVNIVRAASATLGSRFLSEADAGVHEADVFNTANAGVFKRAELWQSLSVEAIPTLAIWPDDAIHANYVNTTQGTFVLAYNSARIPEDEAPKTWEDVLDPRYTGRVVITDSRASNNYINWLDLVVDHYGPDYTARLAALKPILAEGGSQAAQQVSAGAFEVAFPLSYSHAKPLIDQGAPLTIVFPNEHSDVPAIGPMFAWALPATSPHPNAGKVFLTWLLTEDGQKVSCGGNSASIILPDYEGCPKPFANFLPADREISPERQAELLSQLGLQ